MRPSFKKKNSNELNIIEDNNQSNEVKKLKLIINSLTKKLENKGEGNINDAIPKKPRFNNMGTVMFEEKKYQEMMAQSHKQNKNSSDSDSTETEE